MKPQEILAALRESPFLLTQLTEEIGEFAIDEYTRDTENEPKFGEEKTWAEIGQNAVKTLQEYSWDD